MIMGMLTTLTNNTTAIYTVFACEIMTLVRSIDHKELHRLGQSYTTALPTLKLAAEKVPVFASQNAFYIPRKNKSFTSSWN